MGGWYPIKLEPHLRAYAFGGRMFRERLGRERLPEEDLAESWEVSDYRDTTGRVVNGAHAGRTLHELVEEFPDELVGEGWRGPHFPLLLKFLDASGMLPVHLHADDETARRKYGEPNGKTEAWHILWSEPGASVLAGVREGFSREELADALWREDYDAVMLRHGVRPGDTVYVPGGVLHSFGPGMLVYEVQQTSDLGQFASPYDLYGNPLDEKTRRRNIEEVLDELRTDVRPRPNPGLAVREGGNTRTFCCAGPHFALERWELAEEWTEPAHPQRFVALTVVGEGAVRIEYEGGTELLGRATSCILPAALGAARLVPEGRTVVLASYVPDLEQDVAGPLREAGYEDEEIEVLGEVVF
ncbi:MAG: class I mannose-6-phosphate isomerase [Rubrobacteraceae bacterium]|nr:class I mannose-6-phosphate isomerase [Rubrobacteraceae bacterium]